MHALNTHKPLEWLWCFTACGMCANDTIVKQLKCLRFVGTRTYCLIFCIYDIFNQLRNSWCINLPELSLLSSRYRYWKWKTKELQWIAYYEGKAKVKKMTSKHFYRWITSLSMQKPSMEPWKQCILYALIKMIIILKCPVL